MKCYEFHGGKITPGLLVEAGGEGGRLHVAIRLGMVAEGLPTESALLSDQLLAKIEESRCGGIFRHESTRIMDCDVDSRSQLWLITPSPETSRDVLVLASDWFWTTRDDTDAKVAIVCQYQEVAILAQLEVKKFRAAAGSDNYGVGRCVFVRMRRGSWIEVRRARKIRYGMLNLSSYKSTSPRVSFESCKLTVDAEGNLSLSDEATT